MLSDDQRLLTVDLGAAAHIKGEVEISGLPDQERLLGMDFRPATGRLYALGDSGALFVIDHENGAVLDTVVLINAEGSSFAGLQGEAFGVGFNPVPDRLRVTSDSGQNLRINVDTGETIEDGALESGEMATRITASGYTNSFAGTATTRLFNIDSGESLLYQQLPPNDGTLVNPRPLGVTVDLASGFAINGSNNTAFATLSVDGVEGLYQIDLNAEAEEPAAMLLAEIDAVGGGLAGVALPPPAPPQLLALTSLNELAAVAFDQPNSLTLTAISGLDKTDDSLIGLDVRPATGELYAVSRFGDIYTIDPATAQATLQASLFAAEGDAFVGLEGSDFAMDFNPVPDRLRLISDSGQNLRINVDTGETISDGRIALATEDQAEQPGGLLTILVDLLTGPDDEEGSTTVTGAAYTNSFAGTTSTRLFTLDVDNNTLNLQSPPNDGTQVPVGETPVMINGEQTFDIAGGDNGLVLAGLVESAGNATVLYRVNLDDGSFSLLTGDAAGSAIGGGAGPSLRGLTILLR